MTHTPGPWTVFNGRIQAGDFEFLLTNNNGAHVEGWASNARLIAAAPDMLAALKAIKEGLVHWRVGGKEMEMLKAAIAKAEGSRK